MKLSAELRMLDIFLNFACQAKCPFCYNPPLTPELVRWRLPLKRVAAELLKGRRGGYGGVTFSGGEVTLLKELPKMLLAARRAGYERIGIITNGLLMAEPAYTDSLVASGLGFCCVSIHGADAELHDRMVRTAGAFEKVLRTLGHLEERDIPVVLNFVLTRENYRSAAAFVERFAGRRGVLEFQLYYPHYDGLMAEHAEQLALTLSDAVAESRRAISAAESLGAGERIHLYNVPPCAAPGLQDRLRNWEREADSLLIDPKGAADGEFGQERRERFKNAQCRACSLDERCLGFERGYVDRFGERDIRAL